MAPVAPPWLRHCFNIRSLPNKENKSKIETLLEQLPEISDVIAFSEKKNNFSNINLINIAKYQFEHNDSLSNAGGIGLYSCTLEKIYNILLELTLALIVQVVKIYLLKSCLTVILPTLSPINL